MFGIYIGEFGQRHIVAFQCFLGMIISYAMRFCLSIAMTEMTSLPATKEDYDSCPLPEGFNHGNTTLKDTEFHWSGHQIGIVNSAFFWGYVLTQIPGGVAADKLGGRKVIAFGAFMTGLCSIISPIGAKTFGWIGLTVIRVFLGLSQGLFYAAVHTIVGHWIPKDERGTWATLIFSGVHIGNALNNILSGTFLYYVQGRWDLIFFIYGGFGILWSICFFFTTYESPRVHPNLTQQEKDVFKIGAKSDSETSVGKIKRKTPWRSILTSWPVWAAGIAMVGHDFGLFALITDLPKFMKTVLHFDVKKNGMLNALTYVFIWIVSIFAGIISDYIDNQKIISVTTNRKIGTTLASLLPSIGFVASVYVGCNTLLATMCILMGQAFMGFYYPSLKVNPIDLSINFAGTVSSFVLAIGTLSGVVVPYLIGALTPNNTLAEWRIVMWIMFTVMSITNLFYIFFASGKAQPWDKDEDDAISEQCDAKNHVRKNSDVPDGTFKINV